MPKVKSKQSIQHAFAAYKTQILRHKNMSFPALVLPGIAMVFTNYVPPLAIALMIKAFDGKIPTTLDPAIPYITLLAGSWLFGEALWRIAFMFQNRAVARGMRDLYIEGLDGLLAKDMAFYNDNFAGSLTKRLNGFSKNYEGFLDTASFSIFGNVLPLIFAVAILGSISLWLVLALLGVITIALTCVLPLIKKRQQLTAVREQAATAVSGHVADVLGNIAAVQAFAHESHERARHHALVDAYTNSALRSWDYHVMRIDMLIAPLYVITNIIGLIIALVITDDAAAMAAVFITFNYFLNSTRILFEFNRTYRNIENSLTEAAQLTDLLNEPTKLVNAPDATDIHVTKAQIDFNDVHFTYDDSEGDPLFEELQLSIPAGQKVAVVGHSGGGKTTITKLLLRFNDIQSGEILIDGQNIATSTITSLRHSIAYVPQEPAMFHRSIMDNIRYGRPDATDAEVLAAATKAHATEFIGKLPHKFETLVGERGVKLSGGQRQRIAIARAILKNAPILVLDEATSALDSESEKHIQASLNELMKQRTSIVIAHRLSTIQKMDRILVLENGTIVEDGTHAELQHNKGIYATLWSHQSGGFIEE